MIDDVERIEGKCVLDLRREAVDMLLKKGSVRVLACNKVGVAKVVKAGHWQEIIFIIRRIFDFLKFCFKPPLFEI